MVSISSLHGSVNSKLTLLLIVVLGLTALPSSAQESTAQSPSIESSLDQAWDAIETLDALAVTCQVNLEPQDSENLPGAECRDFMAQMHGPAFQSYRSHCDAVLVWRDAQIAQRFAQTTDENTNDVQQSNALLDNMMRAEYVCGVDALARRSEHIIPVYQSIDGVQQQYSDGRQHLLNRIQDLQFQQRETAERQRALRAMEDSRTRQDRLTGELFDRQTLELLRQQLRQEQLRPNP